MGTLDEAYERFRPTGPEWGEDTLTNHGPMAAEVLVRHGRGEVLDGWVDRYAGRLDALPGSREPIVSWRDALGDGARIGDWTAYFEAQVRERPWQEVLVTWWPRLLPGIVAGATHGVIRTAHAARALAAGSAQADPEGAAVAELAHGLAFWAARFRGVPAAADPAGSLDPGAALDRAVRIPQRQGTVAQRFGQLAAHAGWPASLTALRAPADADDARALLADLVTAATLRYRAYGHASPVLLVHTATAPNAVLHTLPLLPRELWAPSLAAVWSASAAITAAYAPAAGDPPPTATSVPDAAAVMDRAVEHGDEHVIKFADTAIGVCERTGEHGALAAALHTATLISPVR
jgi:hypothetical protein